MSNLLRRQMQFAKMLPRLIDKALELGYLVTVGDAYRDPRAAYGNPRSLHRKRLAIDLNLFDRDGNYLRSTEDHRPLGEWWMSNGQEYRWGGMDGRDGNHYSITDGSMTY